MANADRVEIVKGAGLVRRWYWRRRRPNGRIAEGGSGGKRRGYATRAAAVRAAQLAHPELPIIDR